MANPTPRLPRRRTVFRVISIAVTIFLVAIAALALYVYKESVGRFQLRRLSLPTRIYADYTPLQAGTPLQPDDLLDKLDRLGYRQAPAPGKAGDFVAGKGVIDIYTRSFKHPTGDYPAQPIRVTFGNGGIDSVVSVRDAQPLQNAALEPELLTSILSDQLENRQPVTLDQVPQSLQDAVVVTEDVRFWHHPGVDPFGILRAAFRNLRSRGVAEGGSTLTQQLVKNYYLTSERTMKRKVVEAFMAVILDAKYSKRDILEAYLNDIYLGRNRSISILGVGEASRFYFGKPVSEIDVAESALLAGIIRSPNNYSPFNDPAKAMERRNTVLRLMLNQKKIDQATYEKSKAEALPKKPFRQRVGLSSIPFYVDRVLQEMSTNYGIDDVKGRGLQIYTAIDLAAQNAAAQTLEDGLRRIEKGHRRLRRANNPMEGVFIHVDVPTGEIRALVGGRNYDRSQFNRALKAKRQVGSLFKPFVYLTAFEPSLSSQNITPATLVSDTRFVLQRRFASDWSPRNYGDSYHGTVTVAEALEQSLNSASVRIGLACTIPPILKTAKTLGVDTEIDDSNPSVILGAVGIPPIEMAEAYSTIARIGARIPLRTVRFVMNDRGGVLAAPEESKPVQVFPARDAYVLINVMRGVIDRGTAGVVRSMGFRLPAAGKTGTTNDTRDAWFIGFTPRTLALTWVGFDDNTPTGLTGGDAAAPIWTRYMLQETARQPKVDFAPPGGIQVAQIDETSGGLATPNCPRNVIITVAFKAGTEPTLPCPIHSPQQQLPTVDMFGMPIALDTAGITGTEGTTDTSTPPDSTLGGGFGTPPSVPPTTTTMPPSEPPRSEPPRTEPPRSEPPPTDTGQVPPRSDRPRSERPPRTDTGPTSGPPPTTTSVPPPTTTSTPPPPTTTT